MIPQHAGELLTSLARAAIEERLGAVGGAGHTQSGPERPGIVAEADRWLAQPGATFVTLTQQGRLRGCIGSLEAHRPLGEDVRSNAVSAALRDPRFAPLRRDELAGTDVEVSLLSAPEPIAFGSEDEAVAMLRPGVDGVILTAGGRRGTFLPQVWEQLPEARDFLAQLKRKAGLPTDFWSDEVQLQRYTVTAWHEQRHD